VNISPGPTARECAVTSSDDRVAGAVYAEQIAAVFRQMPIALGVNAVNAGLTAAVLTPLAAWPLPFFWFVAVLLVTIGRGVLWWRYRSSSSSAEFDPGRWSVPAACGSLLAGLVWGIGGALMFPMVPQLAQLFLTTVIGGMCAGAIVVSASHRPTLLAFLLSASLPMAVCFFSQGSTPDAVLGTMIIVFAAALALASRQLNGILVQAVRLRFELDEANQRLQTEMAEHRATEAALRQAQKLEAIGHLTGGIAHDFNNLLTVVIGNLVLASERLGEDRAVTPLIDGAVQAAERGVALIQRMLGFARRQRLEPRPVDLGCLLAGIENMLSQTLGPQIRLAVDAPAGAAPVEVDANQLELAILNLAVNARDAMPTGGALSIALVNRHVDRAQPGELPARDYAVIEITDTGTGMDEATLAQALDPFFTTKEAGIGSGLGLPMVQGFAAQSGGAVRLSSAPGAGTTVELWLPETSESPVGLSELTAPGATDAPAPGAQILLCDDDDDVRRVVGAYLGSIGYSVHEAIGAETVLRMLDDNAAVDLLIVDYAMPGMNGTETLRQARRRRPGLKALLITGHAGAVRDGPADVAILRKPFGPGELARVVNATLAV